MTTRKILIEDMQGMEDILLALDGFTMPEMKLFKGDVEEFFNGSERSAGWVSYQE